MVAKRKLQKAPKLTAWDKLIFSICATLIKPSRLLKSAIIIKPATLLRFHKALINHKYHLLYSSKCKRKPGPKGPCDEIIQLIVEMKKHNPRFGARRIAMQITNIFGIEIDFDISFIIINIVLIMH